MGLSKAEAIAGLAAKAGNEIAHADATVALLAMLIALGAILVVPMAHVNVTVTLVLLTVLIVVLALVVGYVRWKFMNWRESRKPSKWRIDSNQCLDGRRIWVSSLNGSLTASPSLRR
jgi:membrane protein implicated in regulation of membrane protease activity